MRGCTPVSRSNRHLWSKHQVNLSNLVVVMLVLVLVLVLVWYL